MFKRLSSGLAALAAVFLLSLIAPASAQTVLSGGNDFMCALAKTEGTVKCWGETRASGQGPSGTTSNAVREVISLTNVVSLASGSGHNCALRSDGTVVCWGDNLYGQVGDPATTVRTVTTPQAVMGLPGPVVGVFSGPTADHTCAITAASTVLCWGYQPIGGGSTAVPTLVPGLSGVRKLAIGAQHTCALRFDGGLDCWGRNASGQLGDGSFTERASPATVVGLSTGVIDVTAGDKHACAVLADGSARCWGEGQDGQLGNGVSKARSPTLNPGSNIPVTPTGLGAGAGASAIASATDATCVALNTGAVRCWGRRPSGGAGDGNTSTSTADIIQPTPVNVVGLSGPAVALGGSNRYVCAVVVSGAVECWGTAPITVAGNDETRATAHLGGLTLDTRRVMAEYRHGTLDYFFLTSRVSEKLLLKAVAPEFALTGNRFFVDPTGLRAGSQPITRYYFDKVARAEQRGSHFYTPLDAERSALNAQNPSNANLPRKPYNEGVDSYAFAPASEGVGGSCAAGQVPVYRAFRGNTRFPDDPNHRFTTDLSLYNSLVTAGWDGEGVKMCVPACGGKTSAKVGKTLNLSTRAHGVSGTATVVDDCTIELSNFNYDGGGLPDVYVWGAKGGNYSSGFRIGSNLFGTPRSNATVTVTLKPGDIDNLDGISIWCERARVSFGDGLFN